MEDEGAIGFIAALLKAEEHLAQRLVKMLLHKKNAMEMVGHHLKGEHFDLGISDGYLIPVLLYLLSQRSQFDARFVGRALFAVTPTDDLSQQWSAAFCDHRYHIYLPLLIVMPHLSARHRRNLFPSKGFLLLKGLFLHPLTE